MSRRALGTAVLVAGLVATGVVPFVTGANAGSCPTWTDAATDATPFSLPAAAASDPNMDIVKTSLETVAGDVVGTIQLTDLKTFSGSGDRFSVFFTASGASLRLFADRDATGESAAIVNISTPATEGAATGKWDQNANTVTITVKQAEVDKIAGKATKGVGATNISSSASGQVNGTATATYDSTTPPTGTTYSVGESCGGAPEPTTSPTSPGSPPPTTPAPGTLPAGYPTTGCSTFTDGATDASPMVAAPVGTGNDADLDVTAVAINSTPTHILAYLKITTLGDKPATFQGDRFQLAFTAGPKSYTFSVGRAGTGTEDPNRGQVGGTTDAKLKVKGTFNKTNSWVVMEIERAGLDSVHGVPLADGAPLTAVKVQTFALAPGNNAYPADTAEHADAAKRTYTLGDSPCFPPPPGILANTGRTSAQYTDAAAVGAKLTNAAGTALAGKTVTFTVGSKSVSAKTNAAGIAGAALNPGLVVGKYSLVTKFAGDSSAGAVTLTTPFSVTVEKTKLVLRVVKSGTKRTVYATLTDDDRRAVAGQTVTWYINGRKVSTGRTSSSGVAILRTAKPTQTVKAVFLGVSGKYAGSSVQKKV